MWKDGEAVMFRADGGWLEGKCHGPSPDVAPTIVMLHEGLGCVDLWRDFPRRLAEATRYGVFAYSRRGYGASDPVALPRPIDYMTREAIDVLPQVFGAIGFTEGVLLGHSDGASIAAIYAGSVQDHRVRGLVLMAPHFFAEPEGLESIRQAREAYDGGDLRARLAKYHADVDGAFRGWNDAWLDPRFEAWNIEEVIAYIRVPVLAVQGHQDRYGTRAQIDSLAAQSYSPVEVEMLEACGHAPFIEQPDRTLALVTDFLCRLDRIEAAQAA